MGAACDGPAKGGPVQPEQHPGCMPAPGQGRRQLMPQVCVNSHQAAAEGDAYTAPEGSSVR